jgi:hypothetical protein
MKGGFDIALTSGHARSILKCGLQTHFSRTMAILNADHGRFERSDEQNCDGHRYYWPEYSMNPERRRKTKLESQSCADQKRA